MDTSSISAIAQYGTAGIAVLQLFIIVWIIQAHNKNIDNRDERMQGLSKSILAVNESTNKILGDYNKIIGNHIDHNTEQMKNSIIQNKDTAKMLGELRDAVNQLVGYMKKN